MESELEGVLSRDLPGCFDRMEREFASRNGVLVFGNGLDVDVSLGVNKIDIEIGKKATITKNEEVRTFENYHVVIDSSLHKLGQVAMEIAEQEAGYPGSYGCHFSSEGYSLVYPQLEVKNYELSEGSKVYVIKDIE